MNSKIPETLTELKKACCKENPVIISGYGNKSTHLGYLSWILNPYRNPMANQMVHILNEILEDTKKRCFCMYCIQTPIVPKIEMIKEYSKEEEEIIHFICPTCFKKSLKFIDDNTQICQECGTTGFFVRNPITKEISLK